MDNDDRDRGFDDDDELRAVLRSADPAASLRHSEPSTVIQLVDETVAAAHPRRRVGTWLVAAAAAAVVVTAGVGAIHNQMSDDPTTVSQVAPAITPGPTAESTSAESSPPAGPATSTLTVSSAAFDARCAVPNATTLSTTDTAFAGTVTSIQGNRVVLQRGDTYRGEVADTVTVRAPAADLSRLVQTVKFKVGGSYLVSAVGGQVALCGLSGPAKPDLLGIYSEAFRR